MVVGSNRVVPAKPTPGTRQERRVAPNNQTWKNDELWFAKHIGSSDHGDTARQPSTGGVAPDVWRRRTNPDGSEEVTLVMEHKSTHVAPDWMIKALRQERDNRTAYPNAKSFIGITYRDKAGKLFRLLVKVVDTKDTWSEDVLEVEDGE